MRKTHLFVTMAMIAGASLTAAPASAQNLSNRLGAVNYAKGQVLTAGHGIAVHLPREVKLRDLYRLHIAGKDAGFEVEVIDQKIPFRSGVDYGNRLPKGYKLRARVVGIDRERSKAGYTYTAAVVFDKLVNKAGLEQGFLGGMAASDPGDLPTWMHERKAEAESHAMNMESLLGVVIPWAGETGPVGIGLMSFLTRTYQNERKRQIALRDARLAAITYLDDDLPPSKFYVVPTLNVEVVR